MKGGYFQRAEVKIRLKEGLIIQKYTLQLFDNRKGDGNSLNWEGESVVFRDCKGTEKTQVTVFPARTLG